MDTTPAPACGASITNPLTHTPVSCTRAPEHTGGHCHDQAGRVHWPRRHTCPTWTLANTAQGKAVVYCWGLHSPEQDAHVGYIQLAPVYFDKP